MTTGLLGDTSFLDTLQQASQVLNDRVSSSPFGNYTPNQASDYVVGPLGGIAQNKFMGDQFQTPNPFNAPYIPEAFNASSVLNAASTSPFNYNFGSYTPGAFNQFYGSPMASPAMATTTTRTGGGGDGRENLERFLRGGSAPLGAVGTEFIGDTGFRINADGTVTKLDPTSLDYKFNKFMSGLLSNTPGNIAKNVLGLSPTSISDVAEQVGDQFGDEAGANFFAEAAKARPSGALTDAQASAARREANRGSQTGSKLGDRAAAGQAGKKAGKLGKGQYGGR